MDRTIARAAAELRAMAAEIDNSADASDNGLYPDGLYEDGMRAAATMLVNRAEELDPET